MERPSIDAGVLVALERGGTPLDQNIPDDADLALAAVTAADLVVGVELADDQRRPRRTASVEALLAAIPGDSVRPAVAREHARLLGHARCAGQPRGAQVLQIAATAAATRRAIFATDAHAFDRLPGIDVCVVGQPVEAPSRHSGVSALHGFRAPPVADTEWARKSTGIKPDRPAFRSLARSLQTRANRAPERK